MISAGNRDSIITARLWDDCPKLWTSSKGKWNGTSIQRFEYTHELAWKVMKDYAEYQGYSDIKGSRDAFRRALEIGLISDSRWMESIIDRNQTSHLYDDDISGNIYLSILNVYFPLFQDFEKRMSLLLSKEHDTEPTLF